MYQVTIVLSVECDSQDWADDFTSDAIDAVDQVIRDWANDSELEGTAQFEGAITAAQDG